MRWNRAFLIAAALIPTVVRAQESYKIEVFKEPPPASLAPAVKAVLNDQGYRLVDDQGKAYAEIWVRKVVPASGKPGGPKGAVLFPILEEGELLGALRFLGEGHDYRDQAIPQGVYTLRYGLQPVNGDHLGVSIYRDYALLLPAGKDTSTANLTQKKLEDQSAAAAGTNHPAILMMLKAPDSAATGEPLVVRDEEHNLWGAVIPLSLEVKGESTPVMLPIQIILIGAVMV
jgi:hypothetical protein